MICDLIATFYDLI